MDARTLHALLPVAIVVGLAFSAYAAYESNTPAAQGSCTVNGFISCQKVDQSGLTTTFGIADYWIGIGGFLALLAVDIPLLRTYKPVYLNALVVLSVLGVLVSLYLGYVELVQIRAVCLICLGSYLSNVVVLGVALALVRARGADAARGERPAAPGPANLLCTAGSRRGR